MRVPCFGSFVRGLSMSFIWVVLRVDISYLEFMFNSVCQ